MAEQKLLLRGWALVGLIVALAGLAFGVYQLRRTMIRAWFVVGPAQREVCAKREAVAARTERSSWRKLRVLLVDGLSLATARGLPNHDRLCREGLELELDVGFPSVSLPVQHALWTGTWQLQSGVQFAIKRLSRPVFPTLPQSLARRRTPQGRSSVAVADSHREIADSFGFSRVEAPAKGKPAWSWKELRRRALAAAGSSAALVFVHALAVDRAGHYHGGDSDEYRAQAKGADELLGAMLAARRPRAALAVLSDHGHLAGGGHGGLEDEVRDVRFCLAGPGIAAGARGRATIVDVGGLLADQLGVAAPACSQGRPLAALLGGQPPPPPPLLAPTLAAQLPGLVCAGLLLACWIIVAARRGARVALREGSCWPLLLGASALVGLLGLPSLSRAYVYPALPTAIWPAALVVLAGALLQIWRQRALEPTVAAAASCCSALIPAALLLGLVGWPTLVPPLRPLLSAWASVSLALALVYVVALAAGLALARLRPASAQERS